MTSNAFSCIIQNGSPKLRPAIIAACTGGAASPALVINVAQQKYERTSCQICTLLSLDRHMTVSTYMEKLPFKNVLLLTMVTSTKSHQASSNDTNLLGDFEASRIYDDEEYFIGKFKIQWKIWKSCIWHPQTAWMVSHLLALRSSIERSVASSTFLARQTYSPYIHPWSDSLTLTWKQHAH